VQYFCDRFHKISQQILVKHINSTWKFGYFFGFSNFTR